MLIMIFFNIVSSGLLLLGLRGEFKAKYIKYPIYSNEISIFSRIRFFVWWKCNLFLIIRKLVIQPTKRKTMETVEINFIELPSTDLVRTEKFYSTTFGWTFVHYGDQYMDILGAGVAGGFAKAEKVTQGGALVVLLNKNLDEIKKLIVQNGGKISVDTFSFPGGKRFQFIDPVGNELAVWCPDGK